MFKGFFKGSQHIIWPLLRVPILCLRPFLRVPILFSKAFLKENVMRKARALHQDKNELEFSSESLLRDDHQAGLCWDEGFPILPMAEAQP